MSDLHALTSEWRQHAIKLRVLASKQDRDKFASEYAWREAIAELCGKADAYDFVAFDLDIRLQAVTTEIDSHKAQWMERVKPLVNALEWCQKVACARSPGPGQLGAIWLSCENALTHARAIGLIEKQEGE